ncbi:MAG: DUF1801 domain-containing protein [Cyclobacteriaceae bacterium]|nr:DUF1801 domain-containing protein [Cyclobacteriaceae bacterium]
MPKPNNLYLGVSEPALVDDFMRQLKHPLKNVVAAVREVILQADPRVGEGIYWNAPTFFFTGPMAEADPKTYPRYLAGFVFNRQDVVRVVFLRGATVKKDGGLLEGTFKDERKLAVFSSLADVKKHTPALQAIIRELIENCASKKKRN